MQDSHPDIHKKSCAVLKLDLLKIHKHQTQAVKGDMWGEGVGDFSTMVYKQAFNFVVGIM